MASDPHSRGRVFDFRQAFWRLRFSSDADNVRLTNACIIIFFYPRYQGSRGVWKKIRKKCVGVTITPGSPQTQKNHVAARR